MVVLMGHYSAYYAVILNTETTKIKRALPPINFHSNIFTFKNVSLKVTQTKRMPRAGEAEAGGKSQEVKQTEELRKHAESIRM